ncbi:aminotransferase class III-fold pyridoxal phosphate-dependent enzyme [Candidatus Bathyarchaeota archaeon]|nr:aminotransferase class III-fold pyridoxal phosphate-dependent enzyme [Candidatus Bathyarchaeota archaeon]
MSYPRIVVDPPGPKAREIIELDAKYASSSTAHLYPAVLESAQDCIVRDVDGNEFIDFNSAGGIMNVGHNHPKVLMAIKEQLGKAIHYGYGSAFYEILPRLSEALNTLVPRENQIRFFYSNSGSEAIEAGMKVATWHTRGQTFLGLTGSTHGRTLGALSLSSANPRHRRYFPSLVRTITVPYPNCYHCRHSQDAADCGCLCFEALENHFTKDVPREDVAALVLEPIQGEGCIIPPESFFKRLHKLIKQEKILLIADEMLTGIGRTGRWFGIDNWGLIPEILCINGSLASGLPLGVTAARADLMDWEPDSHASTMGGNPLACAAAIAVLEIIRSEHLLENATNQGRYMLRRLQEFVGNYPILGEARGKGLLIGLEIVKNKDSSICSDPESARQIILKCWRRGVLCQSVGESTIRFCPPLSISQSLIDSGLEVLEKAIHEVTSQG